MKTTIDLPDDLVRQLKLRAVHEGRKLKDLAADLLRNGLAAPCNADSLQPEIRKDEMTGLPVIQCPRISPHDQPLTPEEVSQVLVEQESQWISGEQNVILPDTNIWLALALSSHDFHSSARDWFASHSQKNSILFCRSTQQSFLRLLSTDIVMRRYDLSPLSNANAWQMMDGFLADARITWEPEPQALEMYWKELAARRTASPKLWMDAYLAAFAIAGAHQLVTTDQAFAQFKGLDTLILTKLAAP